MRITQYKEVTEKREVIIGIKCDGCGKIHNGESMPEGWHEFSAHHNHWGNDSVDSWNWYTACSPECYSRLLDETISEYEEYWSSKIDGFSIDFAKNLSNFLKQVES